jgi:Glycosyltransferase family 87
LFGSSIVSWLRDAPWLTRRRLVVYPRLFAATYAASAVIWILMSHGLADRAGHAIGADFAMLWSASRLAINGTAASVYDTARLWTAERATAASPSLGYTSFSYPPMYLAIVLPLAMLPYVWSLIAWTAATFGVYLGVMWKIDPERDSLWLAIAFPGAMVNLTNGQNGFLTLAFLGGALLSLERRPIAAGVMFGLMSYKPQYGVLVPVFLMTTGRWRAFAAASVTVISFAGLSLAMFGERTWRAFFSSISYTRHIVIEQGGSGFDKMQSAFAAARLWGFSVATAYAFQAAVGLIAALAVIWIWRRTAKFDFQAAALATGMLLVTPYMMDYDLVVLALPIAWLAIEGRRSGFLPWEKSLLVLAWLLPLFARALAGKAMIPIAPLVMMLLLAVIARRSVSLPSESGVTLGG